MKSEKASQFIIIFLLFLILVMSSNPLSYIGNNNLSVEIVSPLESNGGFPVNIQDQTTPPLDIFFVQLNGSITFLQENASIDDYVINVSNVSGNILVGTYLGLSTPNRFYFGEVVSISGNLVTLDTPLDFNYSVGDAVIPTTRDLNVDGSSSPEIFFVGTGGAASNFSFDITRIMIECSTASPVSLNEFCDLPKLDNGVVLRRVDGDTRNIWNVKTNGEIGHLSYDYTPYSATNPAQGQDGALFRYTFAGQDKHGVAVRLENGDALQVIIQDDLSSLESLRILAEGHVVQN